MTSNDYRAVGGMTAIWLLMIAVVDPRGAFPLNDDWSYQAMLGNLVSRHVLLPTDATSVPVVGQILWATPFVWLTGSVLAGARLSTLVLGLVGSLAVFACLRQTGVSTGRSMLGGLAIMTNPLWVSLSCTFLTDVPCAAAGMCAAALLIAARRSGRTSIYAAAVACLVWATLIRHVGRFFAV